MPGITASGFEAKRQPEIKLELEADYKAEIGANINLASEALMGQQVGIQSSAIAEIWELIAALYSAQRLESAEGTHLDDLGKILGIERLPARSSRVELIVNLNAGVTIADQSRVQVLGDESIEFLIDGDVTNGTSGTADFAVSAFASVDGPVRANAGTVTVIVDTIAGWNSVTNLNDAAPGQFDESDVDYRERYRSAISAAGGATPDAIRADVLAIAGVQQATVFENDTNAVNASGMPPHSFEVVVFDGLTPVVDADTIAQAIWDSKPAGIQAFGNTTGIAIDGNGDNQIVSFSRTDVVDVWLEFDVVVDATKFPASGAEAIKAAVAAYGDDNYKTGSDVIASALCVPVFSIAGLISLSATRLGLAASPTGTSDISVGNRELADLDTSRIVVNVL